MIDTKNYVNYDQAKMLKCLGLDGYSRFWFIEPDSILLEHSFVIDALRVDYKKYRPLVCRAPLLTEAAQFLREDLGIDIVVQPRFDSGTGERKGYFWRWVQRTDVNMNPKTHEGYEAALSEALTVILNEIIPAK